MVKGTLTNLTTFRGGIFLWDCWSGFCRLVLLWVRRQVHRRPTQVQVRTKSTFFLKIWPWQELYIVSAANMQFEKITFTKLKNTNRSGLWKERWTLLIFLGSSRTSCRSCYNLSPTRKTQWWAFTVFVVIIDHSRTFLLLIYVLFLVVFVSVSFKQ